MRLFRSALLAAVLMTPSLASAQVLDVSTIKCKEFFESDKERIALVMMWLTAYYKEEDDPPVIDFDKMKTDTAKLAAFCVENPNAGLITAADKVMSKE
jgi:acid stress chaperone HdeB